MKNLIWRNLIWAILNWTKLFDVQMISIVMMSGFENLVNEKNNRLNRNQFDTVYFADSGNILNLNFVHSLKNNCWWNEKKFRKSVWNMFKCCKSNELNEIVFDSCDEFVWRPDELIEKLWWGKCDDEKSKKWKCRDSNEKFDEFENLIKTDDDVVNELKFELISDWINIFFDVLFFSIRFIFRFSVFAFKIFFIHADLVFFSCEFFLIFICFSDGSDAKNRWICSVCFRIFFRRRFFFRNLSVNSVIVVFFF